MPELMSMMMKPETRRKMIREKVVEGLEESFPIKSRNKTIEIRDVRYKEKDYGSDEQKQAILRGDTLSETVKGTVLMRDADGKVIDEVKDFTLARVPFFTPRHTFIIEGKEYSVSSMLRRKPGVYTRKRANGIIEASFNTHGGKNFRVSMDPAKGEPQLEYGTTKIPLYPILRKSGIGHDRIADAWGRKLADQNQGNLYTKSNQYLEKLYKKEIPEYRQDSEATPETQMEQIMDSYSRASMDPTVNARTLGKPYKSVNRDSLLDASTKVLNIFRKSDTVDDQDNLDFKRIISVDDLFKERIKLDAREISRKAAIKMEARPDLKRAIPPAPFTKGLRQFINTSQLASVPTQTNPMELIDAAMRVTSLGEGGISTERAVPVEARQTHVTQIGALDPIRTPESFRAGIDIRAAMLSKRDREGNIYVPVYDVKTNRKKHVRAGELQEEVVAFPNQEMKGTVDALVKGALRRVPASRVRYQVPHPSYMYSPTTNLIPFLESAQGNRGVMGSKMQVQALSLVDREAPYVQVAAPEGGSFERMMGHVINPTSPVDGVVAKIDKDYIYIRPDSDKTAAERTLRRVPYNRNFPLAAKTYLDHKIMVSKGDRVKKEQILGDSNFTRNGTLALGKNMRVAFMPYYGANSNDAVVVSEGAAKKLTSERMYKVTIPRDTDLTFRKNKHRAYYGHAYTKDQYSYLDDEGVAVPGSKIIPGNPVVLGLRKSQPSADDLILGKLHRSLVKPYREYAKDWDHDHEGEVIDVVKTPKQIALTIKTRETTSVGDKIAGRYGNKGVVSQIVPDDQMIQDESGRPIDILMTSAGVVSRINPSQIIETAVGKVVEKTGKPLIVPTFRGIDNVKWAKDLLKKHNIKDKETVYDPVKNKKIPKVFVGNQYIFKLFKSTDTNYSARGVPESYDLNQQPTKGGVHSAKVLGKMEFDALVGYNARNILRDSATIKSQKNDEYWRAIQLGYPAPSPKTSFAYNKFLNMLTGAGIKVNRTKNLISLAPLTDKDVMEMSSGEVKDSKIVQAKDLKPEIGGLFDPAITGGLKGEKWSHINLGEPVISPVFKEPVRRLLGMTNTQLDAVYKEKGGRYIKKELGKIDLDTKEKELLAETKKKSGSQLDDAVKKIKYVRALKAAGLTPDEAYVVSKVPVTPPVTRPVLPMTGSNQIIYGDANPLYQDLIYINNQMKEAKEEKDLIGEEEKLRPALQEAVGAIYGMNEPVTTKSKARGHKGFLTFISGKGSPKYGYFQSKLMKRTQDIAGRGTIVPDQTLDIDEVGLPEDMLWSMYDKFVIRRLVQSGFPAIHAKKMLEDRHPGARNMLMREIQERPVLMNRAPTLHRYNILAATPKPVPGKTIRINPFIEKSMNADFDGDCGNLYTVVKVTKPLSIEHLNFCPQNTERKSKKGKFSFDSDIDTTILPGYYSMHIRDFPRMHKEVIMEENKEVYKVPEGLQVFGFSEKQQKVVLCPVTHYSVHHNLKMLTVTTTSGRTVQVSEDNSLYGFNPLTYEMERFSALDHPDWAVPRAAKAAYTRSSRLVATKFAVDRPILKKKAVNHTSRYKDDEMKVVVPLDEGFGWLLGAYIGDGWVSYNSKARQTRGVALGHSLGIATTEPGTQEAFVSECKRLLTDDGAKRLQWKVYDNPHTYDGHVCNSQKLHVHHAPLAHAIGELFDHKRGAQNKHLPEMFTQAPRSFLLGLLGGLLDTDGTVATVKAKAKKKPQIMVQYITISPRLADEVAALGLLLGVKSRVHAAKRPTSAGNTEYHVYFSAPDFQRIALEVPCKVPKKKKMLKELNEWDFGGHSKKFSKDIVPIPLQFLEPLKKLVGSSYIGKKENLNEEETAERKKRGSLYVTLSKAKKTRRIGRYTFNNFLERYGYDSVCTATSPKWVNLMRNDSIVWEFMEDITPIEGTHTAWDLTVPDGNTFMTANHLIIFDSMQIHVPVSAGAVEEAKGMTISNVLFGDKTKQDLLVFPQHEAIMGVNLASSEDDKNVPKVFKTKADAMKAYNSGKIGIGTRVKIGK